MQLNVQKHYIHFSLKYIPLEYIISVIQTLFKSVLFHKVNIIIIIIIILITTIIIIIIILSKHISITTP